MADKIEYITPLARNMRKAPTEAESKLWNILRNRKLGGYKFRRQEPIWNRYIADFYCPEKKLVIELDGKVHQQADVMEYDTLRNNIFTGAGLKILRIKSEDVLLNLSYVENIILEELNAFNTPSTNALGEGAGGEGKMKEGVNI